MSVFITGVGIVSAIGYNTEENYHSLKNENSGIQPIKLLKSEKKFLAGEVKYSNQQLITKAKLNHHPVSRTAILGTIAAKEAWGNNQAQDNLRTGLISATSVGGMDITEDFYKNNLENKNPDPNLLFNHDSGNTTEWIAKELNFQGYINTLSTACSSGANAIMLGARLIKQNKLDRVLVGGSDAMTNFTINGFNSLMIYDQQWCKPFDQNRNGLNLGEGAGFLLLESEKSMVKTGNKPLCLISGWANAADAYHQTASSPDGKGATLAMKHALEQAQLTPKDISYINVHGTGTQNNDLSESVAILNIFDEEVPALSSTKSYTGHTLAAAGAIEAVFAVLAITKKCIFPNLNFSKSIEETNLEPQKHFQEDREVNSVLSNSFGFGGNNTTLVFKKI